MGQGCACARASTRDDARLYAGQTHALAEEPRARLIVRRPAEEALLALDGSALRLDPAS